MSKGKFKTLVLDIDDCLLPRGWVSSVIPPDREPSEYEASEQSPWKIVESSKNPIEKFKKTKKGKLGKDIADETMVQVFSNGSFKKVKRKDHQKEHMNKVIGKLKAHQHPPLPRGSLIWDYGVGRTYSNPQAAFDAMLAFHGTTPITEHQHIRGYGTAHYTDSNILLHVHGLRTSLGEGHLYIDIDEEADITFEADYAPIMGALNDAEYAVSYVNMIGLKTVTNDQYAYGIAVQQPGIEGALPFNLLDRWVVDDCDIRHSAPIDSLDAQNSQGFLTAGCIRAELKNSKIIGFEWGAMTNPEVDRGWNGFLVIKSSIMHNSRANVWVNPKPKKGNNQPTQQQAFAMNSIFKSTVHIFEQEEDAVGGLQMNNCIAQCTIGSILHLKDKFGPLYLDFVTDGNIFDWGSSFGYDKSGAFSLEYAQAAMFSNEHSFEADPLINEDYTLDPESPAWQAGIGIGYAGIDGNEISRDVIDIGPYQETTVPIPCPSTDCGYCTIQSVIDYTGTEIGDLDNPTDLALETLLCQWIGEVSDIIDQYVNTTYELDDIPSGIKNVCTRMASAYVVEAVQNRKIRTISVDEISKDELASMLLTDEIKELLSTFVVNPQVEGSGGFTLGAGIITSDDEGSIFDAE